MMIMTGRAVRFPLVMLTVLAGLALWLMSGCANLGRHDSDLPWNAPQPWEGMVPLPGGMMQD